MRHRTPTAALAVSLLAACASAPPPGPTTLSSGAPPRPAIDTGPEPGEAHRALDPLLGAWEVELRSAAGELLARGSASVTWGPSGRFLRWESALESEATRSLSTGLLGHDAASNEYQWVWASGWSGRIRLARGRGELRTGGLRLVTEERDPASGATVRARSVIRMPDDDRVEIEQAVELAPGEWRETARTIYTRAREPLDADAARR